MWARSGTNETRTVTLKDEIARILFCAGLIILFSIAVIGLCILQAMIIGPLLGVGIGEVLCFVIIVRLVSPLTYELAPDNHRGLTFAFFLALSAAWWMISYPLLETVWPPTFPFELPFWALSAIITASLAIQATLAGGIYLLASEAFDPNGPTPTRKQADIHHTIWPWTKTNDQAEDPPLALDQPRLVRIHHERENKQGRAQNRDLILPDTAAWHQYARALGNRVSTFSEGSAKNFGISPQDKYNRADHSVSEIGFRSVRDQLKARGYISLVNEHAPNMGYNFEDDFYELMDEWGESGEEGLDSS